MLHLREQEVHRENDQHSLENKVCNQDAFIVWVGLCGQNYVVQVGDQGDLVGQEWVEVLFVCKLQSQWIFVLNQVLNWFAVKNLKVFRVFQRFEELIRNFLLVIMQSWDVQELDTHFLFYGLFCVKHFLVEDFSFNEE